MSRLTKLTYCAFVTCLLCLPLVIVFGVSFNEKKVLFFPPRGFSLDWYWALFIDSNWFQPLITSFLVAMATGVLAITIALPVAYFLWRNGLFYAKALFGLGLLPFAFPPVITAMGMLLLWIGIGRVGQIENIILGHAIFMVALPLTMISLGFESVKDDVLEAASTLGAGPKRIFLTVILPLIFPFIISSFAFVFVLSMNEFVISFFLGQSNTVTLPVQIFSSLRGGYSPTIASASVLFILMAFVIFGLIGLFGNLPKIMGAYERNN